MNGWPPRQAPTASLALGLAHVIMKSGLRPAAAAGTAGALIDGWAQGLPAYTPDQVQQKTGVKAATIERIAREFASNAPAVALIGDAPLAHTNGLFQALAVNALNALVGSVNAEGGLQFSPEPARSASRSITELLGGLSPVSGSEQRGQSPPKILIVDEANLVYLAPPGWKVREFLQQVPFIVSFGSFVDDTSAHADLILPDHSFLESWVEATPESGAMTAAARVAEPTMRPLYDTRSTPDVIIEVSRKLQKPIALPWQSWEEAVKAGGAGGAGGAGVGRLRAVREGREVREVRKVREVRGVRRPSHNSTATRRSTSSTSCLTSRRRCSTARFRICRGCRRCPIR